MSAARVSVLENIDNGITRHSSWLLSHIGRTNRCCLWDLARCGRRDWDGETMKAWLTALAGQTGRGEWLLLWQRAALSCCQHQPVWLRSSCDCSPSGCCNKEPTLNAWPGQVRPFLMPEALPCQSCTGKPPQLCARVHPTHTLGQASPCCLFPRLWLRGAGSCPEEGVNQIQARDVTAKAKHRLWLCKHRPMLDLGTEFQLAGLPLAGTWLVQFNIHQEGFWAGLGN